MEKEWCWGYLFRGFGNATATKSVMIKRLDVSFKQITKNIYILLHDYFEIRWFVALVFKYLLLGFCWNFPGFCWDFVGLLLIKGKITIVLGDTALQIK